MWSSRIGNIEFHSTTSNCRIRLIDSTVQESTTWSVTGNGSEEEVMENATRDLNTTDSLRTENEDIQIRPVFEELINVGKYLLVQVESSRRQYVLYINMLF